jgi:glucose-6-phosphate 1-dehydrogenase
MSAPQADALLFFGATGDLACKRILPSLQDGDVEAYERVLTDAMDGDGTLFAGHDDVEEA